MPHSERTHASGTCSPHTHSAVKARVLAVAHAAGPHAAGTCSLRSHSPDSTGPHSCGCDSSQGCVWPWCMCSCVRSPALTSQGWLPCCVWCVLPAAQILIVEPSASLRSQAMAPAAYPCSCTFSPCAAVGWLSAVHRPAPLTSQSPFPGVGLGDGFLLSFPLSSA